MLTKQQTEKFLEDGWIIVDIPEPGVIREFAEMIEKKAQELSGTDSKLEKIHEVLDEESYAALHLKLADYFWSQEFSIKASPASLPLLKDLIGLDLMVQYMPYLRLARPGKPGDNIGYHKDTQYGQTPYELAVHVPFVDLDEDECLRVISGSHHQPESDYPGEAVDTGIEKGSDQHMLGKPYAAKRLEVPKGKKTSPLAMRVGQAAMFTPAIFHGQEENKGKVTRVTTDLRYVHTNAKINIKAGKTRAGYVPVSVSPVEQAAAGYYAAQPQDDRKMA